MNISQPSHVFLGSIVEKELARIRNPFQLFLKSFRVVFDAAINIDQFTIGIIEHFHLSGDWITSEENPSGSTEHLNIASNLIRESIQDGIAQSAFAADPTEKTLHKIILSKGRKMIPHNRLLICGYALQALDEVRDVVRPAGREDAR